MISQRLLGTREIAVFHHTGCGMVTFDTPQLRALVKEGAPGDAAIAETVDQIDFLEFKDLEGSVKSDVKFLQDNAGVRLDAGGGQSARPTRSPRRRGAAPAISDGSGAQPTRTRLHQR